jgi:hypothetical protein
LGAISPTPKCKVSHQGWERDPLFRPVGTKVWIVKNTSALSLMTSERNTPTERNLISSTVSDARTPDDYILLGCSSV